MERLLVEADGIFAIKSYPWRTAFQCQEHPQELGCLQLGAAARRIPLEIGWLISIDERLV